MLNEWSDLEPEPPPRREAEEFVFLAIVGLLTAFWIASAVAGVDLLLS